MNRQQLQSQNLRFADTNGVSANNQSKGFIPAFQDDETGRVELARFGDGRVATMHLILGLPEEWASEFDDAGQISCLKPEIVAGFYKDGVFYTREEAILACQNK